MLVESCRRFRERYEPGVEDPHTRSCPQCSTWVALMDELPALGARLAVPPHLLRSLREVPGRSLTCREADRLFLDGAPASLPGAPDVRDPARFNPAASRRLEAHRKVCRRCAALYAVLPATRGAELALPQPLRRRLESLAHKTTPIPPALRSWYRAAAASYLLVVFMALAVGNPYPWSRQAVGDLRSRASGLVERFEEAGVELLATVSTQAHQELERQRLKFRGYGDGLRSRFKLLQQKFPPADDAPEPENPPPLTDA